MLQWTAIVTFVSITQLQKHLCQHGIIEWTQHDQHQMSDYFQLNLSR